MKKKHELMAFKPNDFMDIVQRRMAEKYADDVIKLVNETKALKKTVDKFEDFLKRIEKGDFHAVEEYKKVRKNFEDIEDYSI